MKSLNEYWVKTKSYTKECRRVLKVTKKPNKEEFMAITKVTGLGMLVIGLIGFIITLIGWVVGI
ncbi:protein translocase SEC61 complex subunit gamma [archaeon]|jgi:protein transport protein SEC61 subunit gamma and related proteins|nr:protein translocase SEC61 complex subunit gamma [archaeon]MBT3731215.1 protein translocase SEC61 complex subunit gamma [archaeon]MBT4670031.1 protein translocase SEC61 complex subunit gamma [archaeon]MBT5287767.1 protein translocase SEC61 complex subunit gamma [archaeon]MBT7052772.1 protein translocase SEC61 complex subunit gamma [archaeon]